MKNPITKNSVVVAIGEQVSTDLAGKTAILSLKNSTYYSLDAVGSAIWEMIQTEKRVEAIRDALVQRFDVEPLRCESDLVAFLSQLADQRLLEAK